MHSLRAHRKATLLMLAFAFAIGGCFPHALEAQNEPRPVHDGSMPPPSIEADALFPEGLDRYLEPGNTGLFDRFSGRPGQLGLALHSEFTAASSALPYAMLQRLIWGGFIDAELKQQALDASGENPTQVEVAGLEWHNSATLAFGILPASAFADWNGYVRASSSLQLGVAFQPDLYTLLFYGNAPLAGREASLEGTDIRYQRTQKLELGLSMRKALHPGTRLFAGLGLGVVQGIRYDEAQLDGAFLTAEDGSQIDLALNGFYRSTDSVGAWNEAYGWGWSGSGQLRLEHHFKQGLHAVFFAQVQDLGSVRWKHLAQRYDVDSNWRFEGLSIDDLEDLSSGVLLGSDGSATDSLLDLLSIQGSQGPFVSASSPMLSVGMQWALNRMRFGAGYRQRFNSPMKPLFWAQGGYAMAKGAVQPRLNLAYGGWGAWQIGAELRVGLSPSRLDGFRPELRLGATDALGLLAPSAANGGTAYVQLAARF